MLAFITNCSYVPICPHVDLVIDLSLQQHFLVVLGMETRTTEVVTKQIILQIYYLLNYLIQMLSDCLIMLLIIHFYVSVYLLFFLLFSLYTIKLFKFSMCSIKMRNLCESRNSHHLSVCFHRMW